MHVNNEARTADGFSTVNLACSYAFFPNVQEVEGNNMGVRSFISPAVIQLTKLRVQYHLTVSGSTEYENSPLIYAFNHTNSADMPMACRVVKEHCKVLIGKQRLFFSDKLFFWLNGAIWVDRKISRICSVQKRN